MKKLFVVGLVSALGACSFLVDFDALEGQATGDASLEPDVVVGPAAEAGVDASTHPAADGGSAGDAGDAPDAGPHCHGRKGPTPVRVGAYCMDSTEVTRSQYDEFLAAVAQGGVDAGPGCEYKESFKPSIDPAAKDLPVFGADWCDAHAFCAWAGKRLCGAIGGGPPADDVRSNPFADEWFAACSHGGDHGYPYGDSYDPNACNGYQRDAGTYGPLPSGSLKTCEGGYEGLYDLAGNLWEWEDGCTEGGADAICVVRGSSYAAFNDDGCGVTADLPRDRGEANDVTIRCCSDYAP